MVGGDDVTLVDGTGAFASPDAGTQTVSDTGLALSGADAGNYTLASTTATTTATITPATLILTANDASKVYGQDIPTLNGTLSGVVTGDGITASYSTAATQFSDVSDYAITATLNDPNHCLSNYDVTITGGTLAITQAEQVITWADPAGIVHGTPLGGVQLNATVAGVDGGSAAGALIYDPPAGSILDAGQQALTVTAAATTNYYQATATVYINVADAAVWCGSGGDVMWSTSDNWGGAVPQANTPLIFGGSDGLTNENDLTDGTQFNGITFQSNAGGFTLTGNGVTLNGDIVNNSSNLQTIALPLTLAANSTINAASGDVAINGDIGDNGGDLGISKIGAGTALLGGNNTYSGDTVVSQGTLVFTNSAASSGHLQPGDCRWGLGGAGLQFRPLG